MRQLADEQDEKVALMAVKSHRFAPIFFEINRNEQIDDHTFVVFYILRARPPRNKIWRFLFRVFYLWCDKNEVCRQNSKLWSSESRSIEADDDTGTDLYR